MTPKQIQDQLEKLPSELAFASSKQISATEERRKAEENLRTLRASTLLKEKAMNSTLKQYELLAQVDVATEEARLALILKESDEKFWEVKCQEHKETLNAVKVIARLVMNELMNLDPTIKR